MIQSIYNQKVTILNKLRRSDGNTGLDTWFKHEVDNVAWYTDSARSAGGSSVFIGTYITVLIPFNDKYIPYIEWKQPGKQQDYFTISSGDYIVLGEVTEEITAANVVKVLEKYGEDVCLVRHKKACYDRFGATVQLKIEGV